MTTTSGWCEAESATQDLFCLERVHRAYRTCRRRKRGTREVQRYEVALLDRLVETTDDLAARRWQPSRSVCFAVSRPKAREIHAAAFADRVVHHLLVPALDLYCEPIFIHDLYSNRVGKGTHAAVRRLAHFMRRATVNGERPAWYLQLDVRNFFNSIEHGILKGLLRQRLERACPDPRRRNDLLWLGGQVIDGAQQVVYGGDPRALARVPPYKRLAEAGPGRGLPIGNLTSQFFANVYLNGLDQFVKHRLKAGFYVRYVDDMVLVHPDPEQLRAWGEAIAGFLTKRLGLTLKAPQRLRPVGDGADFLGYIVRPWYRLVRRRVLGHMEERLASLEQALGLPVGLPVGPGFLARDGLYPRGAGSGPWEPALGPCGMPERGQARAYGLRDRRAPSPGTPGAYDPVGAGLPALGPGGFAERGRARAHGAGVGAGSPALGVALWHSAGKPAPMGGVGPPAAPAPPGCPARSVPRGRPCRGRAGTGHAPRRSAAGAYRPA
jgi:hypothetical protein